MMKSFLQPIDRTALALLMVLSFLIALLVATGERAGPRVRDFSWQAKQVGAEDTAFILTFSRPMDHASVEENLQIEPLLPGKISWAGRRMAYTLTTPAPYGTTYQVKLTGARERFASKESNGKLIEPFVSQFYTRDRAFAYVGIAPEEKGRLILYNLSKQQKTILTPKNLSVMDFKLYPDGKEILFSAGDTSKNQGLLDQQLYTVTTGLNYSLTEGQKPELAGKVKLVLDNRNYQNLKFDLSSDGQTIVVQRVNRRNPAEFGYWIVRTSDANSPPILQKMETQPGGDFVITPDSGSIAVAQGQGVAILPLPAKTKTETVEVKPLDFLAQFQQVLSFSRDGASSAMVKYNTDYTRSLFLVTNQGLKKEILRTTGSILNCQFHPQSASVYCLLTSLIQSQEYVEQPYLAVIDLKTYKLSPLLVLPIQRDIQMSLSPDGLVLIFDQLVTSDQPPVDNSLRTNEGQTITSSNLWLLPLPSTAPTSQLQPEQIPLLGFHPRWVP